MCLQAGVYRSKMKKNIIIAALAVSLQTASAVTVSSTNLVDATDGSTNPIVDNTGTAIAVGTGFIGIGFFSTISDASLLTSTAAALDSDFTLLGSSATFGGGTGLDGLFSTGSQTGLSATFAGQIAYTVIGNNSTIGSSTQFLIFRHTETFVAVPGTTPNLVVSDSAFGNGAIAGGVGEFGSFTFDTGLGAGAVDSFSLVSLSMIPEPTSVTLIALGSFAFLLRRRR